MLKINWKLWSRFVIQSVSFIFLKYNLKEKQIDNNENFTLIQIYERRLDLAVRVLVYG